jgi:hypothetical protein
MPERRGTSRSARCTSLSFLTQREYPFRLVDGRLGTGVRVTFSFFGGIPRATGPLRSMQRQGESTYRWLVSPGANVITTPCR